MKDEMERLAWRLSKQTVTLITKEEVEDCLSACGLEVVAVCTLERKDEAMKRQAAAVKTLAACEERELSVLRKERTQAHRAKATIDSEREMNALLTEEIERLREALTPSDQTKAAYMSEVECDAGLSSWQTMHYVPWTSIKAIMAMITRRAATLKDGG